MRVDKVQTLRPARTEFENLGVVIFESRAESARRAEALHGSRGGHKRATSTLRLVLLLSSSVVPTTLRSAVVDECTRFLTFLE